MKKLNVAIIGQGRSGRDIHGAYFLNSEANPYYNVKYVVEIDEDRRNRAAKEYSDCVVLSDYTQLFGKTDIDLVVNATFSNTHYCITKDLLEHGFNVLVEKPFCRNRFECSDLIMTAEKCGKVLAVFQQSFCAPYYVKAKEIYDSGILGDIQQVSLRANGFRRRWDWQTLQKRMGGNAYNTGPHPIGIAYGLLDFDENTKIVYSRLASTTLSSGDADDYVKVLFEAPGKPLVDMEIHSTDEYSDYMIKIHGSKGCFKTTARKYEMMYIVDGENPDQPLQEQPLKKEDGCPAYCSEDLKMHKVENEFEGTAFDVGTCDFYKSLYFKLTENKPLVVTPENARVIVGAIEEMHARTPLERKF